MGLGLGLVVPVELGLKLVPAVLRLMVYIFLIFTWPLAILGAEVPGCPEL